jgi:hypothetical protein
LEIAEKQILHYVQDDKPGGYRFFIMYRMTKYVEVDLSSCPGSENMRGELSRRDIGVAA